MKSRPSRRAAPRRRRKDAEWRNPCANKRQKKRVLEGRAAPRIRRAHGKPKAKKRRSRKSRSLHLKWRLASLVDMFSGLEDPRVNRQRRHLLVDIVVSAVCAVIANADTWKDIALWARANQAWLKRFLKLPNGIPSRDTYRRVISRLDGEQLQKAFGQWIGAWWGRSKSKRINIDGKTLRGSQRAASDLGALHVVSAWASEERLSLGQRAVDGKSNEITAIPQLLRLLDLKGALVSIDAMGCQKAIAAEIRQRGGHYVLALKDNHPKLAAAVAQAFDRVVVTENSEGAAKVYQTDERGHGRNEWRLYYVLEAPANLPDRKAWVDLATIGAVFTYTTDAKGHVSHDVRYYLLSRRLSGKAFADVARGHWSIENSLHWVLDVTFHEDDCRIHKDAGAENYSWLRRVAISVLKQETSVNETIRAKRHMAAWDIKYLEKVLVAACGQI